MPGRGRCARRSARRPSSFRRCRAYVGSISAGGRYRRRGSSGNSLRLAQRAADPTHRLEAHERSGAPCSSWATTPPPDAFRAGDALTDPTAQRPRRSAMARRLGCGASPWRRHCGAWAIRRRPCGGVRRPWPWPRSWPHPYSLGLAQYWAACLHCRRRDAPAVQAQAEALLPLATAQGFPLYAGYGTCLRGWALAMQGEGEAGLAQMHQGMAAVVATGWMLSRPFCLVLLAEAAEHVGHVAEGLRLLAEALRAFEASGRGDLLVEAYRLQGELLLRHTAPDAAQAEACFQQALTIARRQQAKSLELRAAMSLSRLWQQQGKRAEAHELLAPIYGWFTEGFDTADLQEAKALLEELGG